MAEKSTILYIKILKKKKERKETAIRVSYLCISHCSVPALSNKNVTGKVPCVLETSRLHFSLVKLPSQDSWGDILPSVNGDLFSFYLVWSNIPGDKERMNWQTTDYAFGVKETSLLIQMQKIVIANNITKTASKKSNCYHGLNSFR